MQYDRVLEQSKVMPQDMRDGEEEQAGKKGKKEGKQKKKKKKK